MNVKSFVNNMDPENTVKGYYDASDQLVMVEPEGSGGSGIRTASVTIENGELNTAFPIFENGTIYCVSQSNEGTFNVPIPCLIECTQSFTYEGAISSPETYFYLISGDCILKVGNR